MNLHDLRGRTASKLAEANVPMTEIRDILGHANLSMTSRYLKTRQRSKVQAFKKLGAHRARKKFKVV